MKATRSATGRHWPHGPVATAVALALCYLLLVALCTSADAFVMRPLLPLLHWELQWLAPRYDVSLDLVEQNGQWLVAAVFRTLEPLIVAGEILPRGVAIDSSTLVGHGLQHVLIVFSVVAAASLRRGAARGALWLGASLGVLLLQLVDTPLVLLGNVEGLIAETAGDRSWHACVLWADFLESGGRLMLAVAVALLCVWFSMRRVGVAHPPRNMPAIIAALMGPGLLLNGGSATEAAVSSVPANAVDKISSQLWQAFASGAPQEVLVLFRPSLKAVARGRLQGAAMDWLRDYSSVPVAFVRVANVAAAERLLALDEVQALMPNLIYRAELSESLPLVQQPDAAAQGYLGTGKSVVVVDTGVDYTRAAFGSCTAPATPASCRVVYAADVAADDGLRDASGHGTHVAGIVAGVAPAAQLVALDVFDANGSTTAAVLTQAIDWAIANQAAYHIAAINLSLGDGTNYTSPCSSPLTNPLKIPLDDARSAGITTVAASGNDGYKNGLSNPACTPNVISVGGVYDANLGARNWGSCSDATTAADKVTCFSNSASFLSLLAPGALIVAAGFSNSGTSMAAPHVAGAAAVLRAAYPNASVAEIETMLKTSDTTAVDAGNGIAKPRLDVRRALGIGSADPPPVVIDEDIPFLPLPALGALAVGLIAARALGRQIRWRKRKRPSDVRVVDSLRWPAHIGADLLE